VICMEISPYRVLRICGYQRQRSLRGGYEVRAGLLGQRRSSTHIRGPAIRCTPPVSPPSGSPAPGDRPRSPVSSPRPKLRDRCRHGAPACSATLQTTPRTPAAVPGLVFWQEQDRPRTSIRSVARADAGRLGQILTFSQCEDIQMGVPTFGGRMVVCYPVHEGSASRSACRRSILAVRNCAQV
jgi:hypothetical protein